MARTTEAAGSNPDDMAASMRLAEVAGLRGEDGEGELAQLERLVAELTEVQTNAAVDEAHAERGARARRDA